MNVFMYVLYRTRIIINHMSWRYKDNITIKYFFNFTRQNDYVLIKDRGA